MFRILLIYMYYIYFISPSQLELGLNHPIGIQRRPRHYWSHFETRKLC